MKLAPINESSGLQPLPASVHADVSQSVNGTTSDALSQSIEEQRSGAQSSQQSVAPQTGATIPQLSFSGFSPLWILLGLAIGIAVALAWLWKYF